MSFGIYALLFVTGASLIAIWANSRLARHAPQDMRATCIHLGISLVACQIVTPLVVGLATATGNPQLRLLAVMGVALPALTYTVLSVIWVIMQLQATMHRGSMR
jgi:chromate transport protein ChrA